METDNSFYVEIEGVTPDSIQLAVNSLPHNVSFISSKKEFLMPSEENGGDFETGTHLVMWFKFSKTGHYRIRPVDVVGSAFTETCTFSGRTSFISR